MTSHRNRPHGNKDSHWLKVVPNAAAHEVIARKTNRNPPAATDSANEERINMFCKTMFTLVCSAALIPAANLSAETLGERFEPQPAGNKFGAREFTLDLF